MSTQLALGIVGAGIGYFFGMPQLGFVIGSLIGSLLDPPKTQGPRLGDLKLQQSTYGRPIPYIWGSGRIAGNVIDQTDLEEHKEKSSGKGGPEVTNFTYSVSMDIMLCQTPVFGEPAILGCTKIWADGRVIWDDTSEEECPFVFYLGTEDQLPDPTFEAIHGVGEVPAYRGCAHAVCTDLYLTDFGNRPPSFEFLLYTGAGNYPSQISVGRGTLPGYSYSWDGEAITVINAQVFSGYMEVWVSKYDLQWNEIYPPVLTNIPNAGVAGPLVDSPYQIFTSIYGIGWWAVNPVGFMVQVGPDISVNYLNDHHNLNGSNYGVTMDGVAYGLASLSPTYINAWTIGGDWIAQALVGAFSANECSLGTSDTGHVYVFHTAGGNMGLWKYDADLNLVQHWDDAAIAPATALHTSGPRGNFTVYKGQLCYNKQVGSAVWLSLANIGSTLTDDTAHQLSQPIVGRISHFAGGLNMNINYGVFTLEPPAGPEKLSKIVGDLINMTPATGMFDVAELTDDVLWFVIASQMTVRNAMQSLRQCFFFDAVESDDQIKCRKRSEVATFEIPTGDLCGRTYGDESGEPLKTIRTREQELPATVTITYIDVDRDYQIGTQSTPRQTMLSEQNTTVECPIGLDADSAMQKCWTLINAAWVEREHFEWSTTRKWAHLEPCDVGLIRGRVIRIQTRTESPDGVLRWTGVLAAPSIYTNEDSGIYVQPGTGAPSDGWVPPAPPRPIVATKLILLDIPLLNETDYPNGPYAAVGPAAVGRWPGCEVYKSVDGGTTYNSVGGSLLPDVIGTAVNALGNWTGGNNFDESNKLNIILDNPDDVLISVSEAAVLNGANGFVIGSEVIGWEVVQYKTATLTAPGQYTLTGFLRGRFGTEWMIGSHGPAENFVLLRPTININGPSSEIGSPRKYKAVTLGQPLADAAAHDFTNYGIPKRTYSPVLIDGGRNAAGDITINWARRTRINGVWRESVEVPLNEAVEKYRVTFYTAAFGAAISYFEITSATTATYSALAQAIDFGTPQNPLCVGVRQWGEYGLGYEGRAII
jgi:hypothetical protein